MRKKLFLRNRKRKGGVGRLTLGIRKKGMLKKMGGVDENGEFVEEGGRVILNIIEKRMT